VSGVPAKKKINSGVVPIIYREIGLLLTFFMDLLLPLDGSGVPDPVGGLPCGRGSFLLPSSWTES